MEDEGEEDNPSRLQRAGGRPTSVERSGTPRDGDDDPAGLVGVGKYFGGERGVCAHRTLMEELSMTGAQFLDLVVRGMMILDNSVSKTVPLQRLFRRRLTLAENNLIRICRRECLNRYRPTTGTGLLEEAR